ncbi:MAG: sterol desaturase family protein, partial [Geminicoccaceae bacterium]
MIDPLTDFLTSGILSLIVALQALAGPAIFFFCLALIIKKKALFDDLRRAVGETGLNLKIVIVNVLLTVPLIAVLNQAIHHVLKTHDLLLITPEAWEGLPVWSVMLFAVFIGDFVGYWRHRLEHTALLWPSHAVHHSDTEMTWLTLERFHPINRATTGVIDNLVLFLMGVPPVALIANNLVRHYYGYLIHADLPWTYGRLSLLFVSPAMHRWHHAADARFFQKNFATVFSIFDRAFGTYRVPGPCTSPLGVTDKMAPSVA